SISTPWWRPMASTRTSENIGASRLLTAMKAKFLETVRLMSSDAAPYGCRLDRTREGREVALAAQPGLADVHAVLEGRRRRPAEHLARPVDPDGGVLGHQADVHALETARTLRECAVDPQHLHLELGAPERDRRWKRLAAHAGEVSEVLGPRHRALAG